MHVINRDLVIDLFSLDMKRSDRNGYKIFSTEYDSLTQEFCLRRVIRDLGYKITTTEKKTDDDDDVIEKHFITNIPIEQAEQMARIYEEYMWTDEVVFMSDSDNQQNDDD